MYKIKVVQKSGLINIEHYPSMGKALARFNDLKAKKEKYCLNMHIHLEELINVRMDEYVVHRIG